MILRKGFTLVELLVVITIIVVLLALLTPALDKAVYQAELAVCGANLHAVGTGAQTYAMDHKRSYPNRVAAAWPQQLSDAYLGDDRPMLREYIAINGPMRCPLAGKIDLDSQQLDAANRRVMAYSSYLLWFGMYYEVPNSQSKALRRLGDRWSYVDSQFSVDSDILAMDEDIIASAGTAAGYSMAGHPDAEGKMVRWVLDNRVWDNEAGVAITGGVTYAFSRWISTVPRGTIDNNYVYTDGSVGRINAVAFNDPAPDKDIGLVPLHRYDGHDYEIQVPAGR